MATRIDLTANENLSDENIEKAQSLLEDGGTKKAACEILGIKYNTKRLDTIITKYYEGKERTKRLRAKKRKEAVSKDERASIVSDYIQGTPVSELSDQYYRSTAVINRVIDSAGARIISPKTDYFNPIELPEECVADSFDVGELVWSTRYNCLVEVMAKVNADTYRVWVSGAYEQQSYQETWELGKLTHLADLGVKLRAGFKPSDEIKYAISEAFRNSKTVKLK